MVDVISLLSEPIEDSENTGWISPNRVIIVVTDEMEEPETNTSIPQFYESSQPLANRKIARDQPPGKKRRRSILDLGNWMSSEEDSFSANPRNTPLQNQHTSKTELVFNPQPSMKDVLLSSPTTERIHGHIVDLDLEQPPTDYEPVMNYPFSASIFDENRSLEQQVDQRRTENVTPMPASVSTRRRRQVSHLTSDPIESSSPMKAAPAPKKTKKSRAKDTDTNECSSRAWKDANKVARRKQDILSEMVIEISLCLQKKIETEYFKSVFLLPSVRSTYLEIPLISWKRRVTAKYNKEEDHFVPCDLCEISERVLFLVYDPADLVVKLKNGIIASDIERAKKRASAEDSLKDYFVCIMVPGFSVFLRKLQTKEDRKYRERTLQQLHQTQLALNTSNVTSMSASEALRLLIESEVQLGVCIFTTKTIEESIDWLHSFTYTIGSSLYDKYERNSKFSNIGVVRLGANSKGTFLEMIKKFNLMTEPRVENLYQYYASPLSIYKRLLENGDLGAVRGRTIVPPSVSKVMKMVFTSRDPNAVITD